MHLDLDKALPPGGLVRRDNVPTTLTTDLNAPHLHPASAPSANLVYAARPSWLVICCHHVHPSIKADGLQVLAPIQIREPCRGRPILAATNL